MTEQAMALWEVGCRPEGLYLNRKAKQFCLIGVMDEYDNFILAPAHAAAILEKAALDAIDEATADYTIHRCPMYGYKIEWGFCNGQTGQTQYMDSLPEALAAAIQKVRKDTEEEN